MIVKLKQIELQLLSGRGVYWPAQRMLLVADLHLGKEATFRANGLAVPRGATDATLGVITQMIAQTGAERLTILGDLFHARSSLVESVRESFTRFLGLHRALDVTLVVGNHDVATGPLSGQWPLRVVAPPWIVDAVTLEHFPGPPRRATALGECVLPAEATALGECLLPSEDSRICLAGHLHPAVRLGDAISTAGKLPCFFFDSANSCLILPAIGQFTGTAVVQPTGGDRVWVLADGEVIEVATARSRRRKQFR
jgi:metallophosphoesterase superfamily enzyme